LKHSLLHSNQTEDETKKPLNWARELSQGIVSLKQFEDLGLISAEFQNDPSLDQVKQNFDFRLPKEVLKGVLEQDLTLFKQFVPSVEELQFKETELQDPIGDERWTPVKGLTHRYPDRALLKVTYQCASYCRFCFRRYKVSDSDNNLSEAELNDCYLYLEQNPQIGEVILTGGDPLVLTDARLEKIFKELEKIEHIKIIRIHSRIPTILPSRITPELIKIFESSTKSIWLIAHVNTVTELGENALLAIAGLKKSGVNLLSQSVLLKDVNDSVEQLESLFKKLLVIGVKPYYLHQTDLAQGTGHFRVPLEKAVALVSQLRGRITGMAIPQLIVDIPGGHGKVVAEKEWAVQNEKGDWRFLSPITGEWIGVQGF
jgi:lysine 2,3-aminomutase